jgi:SAM-dependent methyltransferase
MNASNTLTHHQPTRLLRLVGLVVADTGEVGVRPPLSAAYFDGWYAQMARFPAKAEIQQRHLGLPSHVPSTGSLTGTGIGEVCAALRLSPGGTVLDLACGRGGYGLEVAARTGARLIGVDFSAEALGQAGRLAEQLGRPAEFRLGDLTATGLGSGSVDGVLCVDSIQFATPQVSAYAEIRRILVPGGRVVLTGWEPVDRGDPRLVSPPAGRRPPGRPALRRLRRGGRPRATRLAADRTTHVGGSRHRRPR